MPLVEGNVGGVEIVVDPAEVAGIVLGEDFVHGRRRDVVAVRFKGGAAMDVVVGSGDGFSDFIRRVIEASDRANG